MGMAHFTSGKNGFDYFSHSKYGYPHGVSIQREKLIEILKVEERLRISKEYQDKYNEKDDLKWYVLIFLNFLLIFFFICHFVSRRNIKII